LNFCRFQICGLLAAWLLLLACIAEEPSSELQDLPEQARKSVKALFVENSHIRSCLNRDNDSTPRYSLSPNGNFLAEYKGLKFNSGSRFIKNRVSYDGQKTFEIYSTHEGSLRLPKIKQIRTNSRQSHTGFAWDMDSNFLYRPLVYPAQIYSANIGTDETKEVKFNDIDNGAGIEGQHTLTTATLLKSQRSVNYKNWQPNIFGESVFKYRNGNRERDQFLQVQLGETIVDFKLDKFRDNLNLLPAQNFSSKDTSSRAVKHFYYTSNLGENFTSLYQAKVKIGTLEPLLIHRPKDSDIYHVSTSRLGDELFWAISGRGMPEYKFFSQNAQNLFNLIDMKEPHLSKIISIDLNEKYVVIQRESLRYGLEYLLVDMEVKQTSVLYRCFRSSDNVWAKITDFTLKSSVGSDLTGYIYSPPNSTVLNNFPTVVYVHGGPSERDYPSWNNLVYKGLVDRGYVVVALNYSGSTGYGREFREAGWRNFSRSRKDIVETAEYLLQKKIADPEKLILMGNSYGAYLTVSTVMFEEHPFKLAISRNGITDLISFFEEPYRLMGKKELYYSKDSDVFGNIDIPKHRAYLEQNSPINFPSKLDVPLLMFHAIDDKKIPFHQSESFFEMAEENELEVTFVPIEGGHNLSSLAVVEKLITSSDSFLNE